MTRDPNMQSTELKQPRESAQDASPSCGVTLSDLFSMSDDIDIGCSSEKIGLRARILDI